MLVTNQHFKSIDIMKGIAMIMIIMVHYEQNFDLCKWFHYFRMGCPMFFVCSGFGIMCLISRKFSGVIKSKVSLRSFYFSRFKALAPGWYLVIIFSFIVDTTMIYFTGSTLSFGTNREPLAILLNVLFLHGFFPFCNNSVMPGGWYIGTTAVLYAITPLVLILMSKIKNKRIYFVLSSVIGMIFFTILYLVFKDEFISNGFAYFFFTVHYPDYLLGIMLYYDLKENILNELQIKICLPIGVVIFAIAYALSYCDISFSSIPSAWATALGTYLVLYYFISNESEYPKTKVGTVLASYGKNSYGIFLLHTFWAWQFISYTEKIANHFGFSIYNIPCFIVMIPIVLIGAYYTGIVFNKIIKRVTIMVFH